MTPAAISRATLLVPLRSPAGPEGVGVVIKEVRSYRDRAQGPVSVLTEPLYEGGVLCADADTTAVHKPCTDVIVTGSVYAAQPRAHIDASVEIGPARRRVRVHGERRIRVRGDRVDLEQAGSVTEAKLSYKEAYGGTIGSRAEGRGRFGRRANEAIENAPDAYPRNPVGRGYAFGPAVAALDGALAPSQEDPGDPIHAHRLVRRDHSDWVGAPVPGGFGPIDMTWFPRAHLLMPFALDRGTSAYEERLGALRNDDFGRPVFPPDPRILSCAAPGLGVARLTGRETLRLEGMRWGRGTATLPLGASALAVRLVFPGAGGYDLETRMATVHVDADAERITIVWGAFQPTALPYPAEQIEKIRIEVRSP